MNFLYTLYLIKGLAIRPPSDPLPTLHHPKVVPFLKPSFTWHPLHDNGDDDEEDDDEGGEDDDDEEDDE